MMCNHEQLEPGKLYRFSNYKAQDLFDHCEMNKIGDWHVSYPTNKLLNTETWVLLEKLDSCYEQEAQRHIIPARLRILVCDGRIGIVHISESSMFEEVVCSV